MLTETYLSKMKEKMEEYPDAHFYLVTRTLPEKVMKLIENDDRLEYCPTLAPSKKLFVDYKYHGLPWEKYVPIFLQEMESIEAQEKMKDIIEESKNRTVFLVCVEKTTKSCHRFLLLDLMRKLDN